MSTPSTQRHPYKRIFVRHNTDFTEFHRRTSDVAILGGGITGLASAYFLSKRLPDAKITVFEGSDRLGGWVHSKSVDVGTGKVVFESGPRTLRPAIPNGLITLDLIQALGLEDRLITIPKTSPAALNRYIYFPDHLVRMPNSLTSLASNLGPFAPERLFKGVISSLLREPFRRFPQNDEDESIGSFMSRHFGPSAADNIVSAVFHGIYAGDIYNLSMRSLLPRLWFVEKRYGSVLRGLFEDMLVTARPISEEDYAWFQRRKEEVPQPSASDRFPLRKSGTQTIADGLERARESSVFTFQGGLGELVDRLEEELEQSPNVLILKNNQVTKLKFLDMGVNTRIELKTQQSLSGHEKELHEFTHVISTIPGRKLANIVSEDKPLPSLLSTKSVTVMVVNLFYSRRGFLPVQGFGYLIPRSIPTKQNPHGALGVIFDSDATPGQDTSEGTKVTVMLGGHWWDELDSYPTEDEGVSMAKDLLKMHLGISEEPTAARASLQKDCIPQYAVGHERRMFDAFHELNAYKGRLRVAGSSYTGVGFNDCVRAAQDVADRLVDRPSQNGLNGFDGFDMPDDFDGFEVGRRYRMVPRNTLKVVR